jgi:cobalt-zinc-cadmium efflux system protein
MSSHHSHSHEHAEDAHSTSGANAFVFPFFLILIFAVLELFGGVYTQSLALLSDAWHMFSDVFALGIAWFAAYWAAKPSSKKHANGRSHVEIMASIINVIVMLMVVAYIVFEAIERFKNPQPVTGGYVMLIAFAGLIVNIIVAKMLHHDDHDDHNRRAAYLHVLGDLLGSVAALAAGAVIYFTGWMPIDPLLSLLISMLILVVTTKLALDIWRSVITVQ